MKYLYSLIRIVSKPAYFTVVVLVALSVILLSNLLSVYKFLKWVVVTDLLTFFSKLKIVWSWGVIGGWSINSTLASRLIIVIVALLAGINVSVLVFYFRKKFKLQKSAGLGVIGVFTSFLGIGCTACGSVILSTIFGLGATAAVLNYLPLKGYEIGLFSIILLLVSTYNIIKKINNPVLCEIKKINKE